MFTLLLVLQFVFMNVQCVEYCCICRRQVHTLDQDPLLIHSPIYQSHTHANLRLLSESQRGNDRVCSTCHLATSSRGTILLQSQLPGAGIGVFSTGYYMTGEFLLDNTLSVYGGTEMRNMFGFDDFVPENFPTIDPSYLLRCNTVENGHYYLAGNNAISHGPYVNCGINRSQQERKRIFHNNIQFVSPSSIDDNAQMNPVFRNRVLLEAIDDIYPGDELFMDYHWNDTLWHDMHLPVPSWENLITQQQFGLPFQWRETCTMYGYLTTTDHNRPLEDMFLVTSTRPSLAANPSYQPQNILPVIE